MFAGNSDRSWFLFSTGSYGWTPWRRTTNVSPGSLPTDFQRSQMTTSS